VEWEKVGLVLWQAPLPEGEAAGLLQAFIERGGQVIFFPPRVPGSAEFLGVRWESWTESPGGALTEGEESRDSRETGAAIKTSWRTRRAAPHCSRSITGAQVLRTGR